MEKSLAGDVSGDLRRAIGHRGDHGAAFHREPESGDRNPGRMAGFYRAEGDAGRDNPDIDKRDEKRIKRYRRDRTGSALVPMEVGIRAELGSAWVRMLVLGCWC